MQNTSFKLISRFLLHQRKGLLSLPNESFCHLNFIYTVTVHVSLPDVLQCLRLRNFAGALMKTLTAIDSHSLWLVSRIALIAGNSEKYIVSKSHKMVWFLKENKSWVFASFQLFELMLSDILVQWLLTIENKRRKKILLHSGFFCVHSLSFDQS